MTGKRFKFGGSWFFVIFVLLLWVVLFAKFFNRNVPEEGFFVAFLENLQTAPTISLDWITVLDRIQLPTLSVPSSGFGQALLAGYVFLAKLVDCLASIAKFLAFVGTSCLNCLSFLMWGVKWIMLG